MNQTHIDILIEELVSLDPSFAAHRASLGEILTQLSQTKENIEISEQFVSTLRKQVLTAHTPEHTHLSFIQQLFHTIHMNTKQITLGSAGVLATLAIVVSAYTFFDRTSPIQYVQQQPPAEEQTLALGPNAFGSLGSIDVSGTILPAGAEAFVSSRSAVSSDTAAVTPSIALGGEAISAVEPAADKMMIMPWFQFDYTYVGEDIALPTDSPVYRRLLSNKSASSAATALRSVNNGIITLPNGLVAEQVSVRTVGNDGYLYQLDFANEQVSLYEQTNEYIDNWNSRNALSEEQLVQIASDFLAVQGVSLDAYGTPVLDKLYMKYAENGSEVPQFLTVIFPLMTPSGEIIYTQNGELPAGIGVTVDQARNKVTSVWNIKRAVFESSVYALTTDISRVLTVATQGGSVSAPWYSEEAELTVLELGTPMVVYTEYYRYNESTQKNEELYIPSLRFPVVSSPNLDVYYSPTYVTVPLVAELLIEPEYEVGVPMPRPMPVEPYDAASSDILR